MKGDKKKVQPKPKTAKRGKKRKREVASVDVKAISLNASDKKSLLRRRQSGQHVVV